MLDQEQLRRVYLFVEQLELEVGALDDSAAGEAVIDTAQLLRQARGLARGVRRLCDDWMVSTDGGNDGRDR